MESEIRHYIYREFRTHNCIAGEKLSMRHIRISLYSRLPIEKKRKLIPCLNQMMREGLLAYQRYPQEAISLTDLGYRMSLK